MPLRDEGADARNEAWAEVLRRHGGELGRQVLDHDWSTSPLGPWQTWPESLRTSVGICLTSGFPMLVLWGPELVVVHNDAYVPILGPRQREHTLGEPMKQVWPEMADQFLPLLESVLSGGGAVSAADQLVRVNRRGYLEEVYVTFSYSPIVDLAQLGSVGGVLCTVTETTRHVLYERRVAVLTRLASELADLPSTGEICAQAQVILESNASDHPLVGVYEIVNGDGVPVVSRGHVPEGLRGALEHAAKEALRTDEPVMIDLRETADGPPAPAEPAAPDTVGQAPVCAVHALPIRVTGNGRASALLVVGQHLQRSWDDSYRHYLQVAALHLRTAMAGARELRVERGRLAALQQLDADKSLFFTNISHELRTPLTLVQGPVEALLTDPSIPAEVHEQLELVERNVGRLVRIVDATLDFSRIEAGGIRTELAQVDATALTQSLAAAFETAFATAGLAFTVDCEQLPRTALLDRDLYERIVLNLLSNALKYTLEGSVGLRLHDAGDRFEVAVTDTGIGISASDQERIFGRFERVARHAGARAHEGAGIGLAMVRQLSELLGGTVALQSAPGTGSTFTVTLPYDSPAKPGPAGTPEPVGRPEATTVRGAVASRVSRRGAASFLAEANTWRGLQPPQPHSPTQHPSPPRPDHAARLLVADDNADMRAYLQKVLAEDYEIDLVPDGQTALDRCREQVPGLVLADVMMPGLGGFALVKELRADPRTSEVPIILLSARASEEATIAGLEHGADDYVVKPFSAAELLARIASNLERARSRSRDGAWRRAVIETLQDPLAIADASGTIIEVNDAFTQLLGWDLSDGPIEVPHPWWPTADTDPETAALVQAAFAQFQTGEPFNAELQLRTKTGRRVWVSVAGRVVDGSVKSPELVVVTLRDVTRWHEARRRREAAARLSAEFGTAQDLDQVLAGAVAGFTELFDGDSTVSAIASAQDELFTAAGPVRSTDLLPQIIEGLAGDPDASPLPGRVPGLLIAPKSDSTECRVWVQFRRPRVVGADERIVGDLLGQAFALAVERVVAASDFAGREANLQRAIESHRHIGQAIGILVERHRITPAEAFAQLKRASQDRNIKLHEIATRVIETGAEASDAQ
ncbi:MAG: response regulator [Intrasporangium sp.]|uniref:ATP-binding protein n=1 Tax=Intrasporangium sp. TaxID=1925024 RepID=UPI00264A4688|nr:ATP-binding protein [Intrasporangium sp.]MDN5797163.1 response regulator [Intrasporangium sp.]